MFSFPCFFFILIPSRTFDWQRWCWPSSSPSWSASSPSCWSTWSTTTWPSRPSTSLPVFSPGCPPPSTLSSTLSRTGSISRFYPHPRLFVHHSLPHLRKHLLQPARHSCCLKIIFVQAFKKLLCVDKSRTRGGQRTTTSQVCNPLSHHHHHCFHCHHVSTSSYSSWWWYSGKRSISDESEQDFHYRDGSVQGGKRSGWLG